MTKRISIQLKDSYKSASIRSHFSVKKALLPQEKLPSQKKSERKKKDPGGVLSETDYTQFRRHIKKIFHKIR